MNSILLTLICLSISGSILSMLFLLVKNFIKNKFSYTWVYYIWLIIILRFIIPFSFEGNIINTFYSLYENQAPISQNSYQNNLDNIENDISKDELEFSEPFSNIDDKTINIPIQLTKKHDIQKILEYIFIIWFIISIISISQKITGYRSFNKFINIGSKKILDVNIQKIYNQELQKLRINHPPTLFYNNQVSSPMLVGIFKTKIVLPNLNINSNELEQIFKHELIHYKRKDSICKWVMQIIKSIHWFNPIVYYISKDINKICELSCDEMVIKNQNEDGRKIYGDALISTINTEGNYNNFVVSITMCESVSIIKERLDMIMSYKKKSKLVSFLSITLTILFIAGFAFTDAYASTTDKFINDLPKSSLYAEDSEKYISSSNNTDSNLIKNINLNIKNTNIIVKFSFSNEFVYDYDKSTHSINSYINNSNIEINIDKINQTSNNSNNIITNMIILYIPNQAYNQININANGSGVSLPQLNADFNIVSDNGSIGIQVPENFNKKLNLKLFNGSGSLNINPNTNNYGIKILSNSCAISMPSNFPSYNHQKTWEYTKGVNNANISLDLSKCSFAINEIDLSTSNNYNINNTQTITESITNSITETKIYEDKLNQYTKWGISFKDDSYYYNNQLVRIFMDMRENNSFETFRYNVSGTIDVKLIRDNSGKIVKLETLSKDEIYDILDDLYTKDSKGKKSHSEISRLTLDEIPSDIKNIIANQCEDTKFYIIEKQNIKYVYYNNLAGGYAYELDNNTLNIINFNSLEKCPVLLSIENSSDLNILYNYKHINYTTIKA